MLPLQLLVQASALWIRVVLAVLLRQWLHLGLHNAVVLLEQDLVLVAVHAHPTFRLLLQEVQFLCHPPLMHRMPSRPKNLGLLNHLCLLRFLHRFPQATHLRLCMSRHSHLYRHLLLPLQVCSSSSSQ